MAVLCRCGMVYMEPSSMGFDPLLQSWLQSTPPMLSKNLEGLESIFNHLVPTMDGGVFFVRKQLKEVRP